MLDVILSIVFLNKENQILNIVRIFTEPFLKPGRILQEKVAPELPIDFSPMVALLIIYVLEKLIMTFL